jgi:hypothetical protein
MDILEIIYTLKDNYYKYISILGHFDSNHLKDDQDCFPQQIDKYIRRLSRIEDEVIEFRLKKILKEEHPYIPIINTDKLKLGKIYPNLPFPHVIDHFLKQRRELLKFLEKLPKEKWARTGVHEKEGHVEFKEYVERLAKRDDSIITELESLKKPV